MGHGSIFISVAEDSADVHAASLVRAAADLLPGVRFYGLTGPRLRALGVETTFDLAAHAAMLSGVFSIIGRAMAAVAAVEAAWRARRPDAVVLVDSPELHLRLARKARKLGIPVLYYIAPQTWASRAYRNRRIARDVERLACILPFEEEYFRGVGVHATYVGHPLFEALAREKPVESVVARLKSGGGPLVALLPGSRKHVIDAVLPLQAEVLAHLRRAGVSFRAAVSAVDEERAARIRRLLGEARCDGEVVVGDNASLLTAADLVLVASGTATLHVAHYRRPMIVMYDAGPFLAAGHRLLGRWIVRTPHLSLVNILAGARIVPEFMPSVPEPRLVARVAQDLLVDRGARDSMIAGLDRVVAPLEKSEASRRVCEMLRELAGS